MFTKKARLYALLSLLSVCACAAPPTTIETSADPDEPATRTEALVSSGISFSFEPLDARLMPVSWDHRVLATRRVWGCYGYDILQGSGWFRSTWYRTYTPVPSAHGYTVDLEQTVRAAFCNAKMDFANSVHVEFADPSAPDGMLRGVFGVNPDGSTSVTTVTCRRNPAGSETDGITCDEAHVAVPRRGTVTVRIAWAD